MPEGFAFVDGNGGTVPELYVCDHEVTQGEYGTYCGYGSSSPSGTYGIGDDYPAYYVSWYDALIYCNERSMTEGLTPCYTIDESTDPADWSGIVTGSGGKPCGPSSNLFNWKNVTVDTSANGYRLPTKAEWEYAARGGSANESYIYSGGADIEAVAWYSGNSGGKSHEVKTKAPNCLGLYDMTGNVCEWCWDKYDASSNNRLVAGGGWSSTSASCDISGRGSWLPHQRNSSDDRYGFRVVRTVP